MTRDRIGPSGPGRDTTNKGPTTADRKTLNKIEQMMERIGQAEENGEHEKARRLSRELAEFLGLYE